LVFKQEKLDGKWLIDGGYMENNPYKMVDDVCDEVVIVSLKPHLLTSKLKKNPKYTIIKTWDKDFPKILEFEKEKMQYGLKLGYDDTMKVYGKISE
ncbi:MAG: patatin-like phospholipase family protein, partial [Finegoldia magna]|nr:patatin-like phospholipase family protein [Finegoldia magna]